MYCAVANNNGEWYMSDVKQFHLANTKTGRKLAGVCSGICNYTGWDVNLLRLLWVLLVVFYGFGLGAYILVWLISWLVVGYDD